MQVMHLAMARERYLFDEGAVIKVERAFSRAQMSNYKPFAIVQA